MLAGSKRERKKTSANKVVRRNRLANTPAMKSKGRIAGISLEGLSIT